MAALLENPCQTQKMRIDAARKNSRRSKTRLRKLVISGYRSCKDVSIEFGSMHAIVGCNNAVKSTILKAIDFLFNPSSREINENTFWNGDGSKKIQVEGVFGDLTASETETPKGCFAAANGTVIAGDAGMVFTPLCSAESAMCGVSYTQRQT